MHIFCNKHITKSVRMLCNKQPRTLQHTNQKHVTQNCNPIKVYTLIFLRWRLFFFLLFYPPPPPHPQNNNNHSRKKPCSCSYSPTEQREVIMWLFGMFFCCGLKQKRNMVLSKWPGEMLQFVLCTLTTCFSDYFPSPRVTCTKTSTQYIHQLLLAQAGQHSTVAAWFTPPPPPK